MAPLAERVPRARSRGSALQAPSPDGRPQSSPREPPSSPSPSRPKSNSGAPLSSTSHSGRRLARPSGGSEKERRPMPMAEQRQKDPTGSQKERRETDASIWGSPSSHTLSPIDRRLDRQKARAWGEEDDVDDLFGPSSLCRPFVEDVDDDSMAYHLELLSELPTIVKTLQCSDIGEVRQAAEQVRELSRGTLPVVMQLAEFGALAAVMGLLRHADQAVVESTVLAIANMGRHPKIAKRLADEGVMASLSTVFVRAGQAAPKPHTSLQGNVAAAYLALFSSLQTLRSAVMLTGPGILKSLLLLAGPLAGRNYQGRKDALKLLMVLCDRPDVRTQLVSLGAVEGLVSTVESGDDEVFEEVAGLMLIISKSSEGVRQLCNLPPKCPKVGASLSANSDRGAPAEAMKELVLSATSLEPECSGQETSGSSPCARAREGSAGAEGAKRAPGVEALVQLLSPHSSVTTQECAASALMRILTRGMADCSRVVRSNPTLRPALKYILLEGSGKIKMKADGLLDALSSGQ